MPYPDSQFPERIWDGLTANPDRININSEVNPDNEDYQRLSSELIAAQENGGATLFPPITGGGPITVIDNDGAEFPLTTSAIFLVDATSGAFTVDLPPASQMSGNTLTLKKIDASSNVITMDGDAAETIDDQLTQTLTTQYNSVTMVSNGTGWFII